MLPHVRLSNDPVIHVANSRRFRSGRGATRCHVQFRTHEGDPVNQPQAHVVTTPATCLFCLRRGRL